jgi:hypothetical protein
MMVLVRSDGLGWKWGRVVGGKKDAQTGEWLWVLIGKHYYQWVHRTQVKEVHRG